MIAPITMVVPVAVTLSACRRRVAVLVWLLAVLVWLLAALAVRAQDTEAPAVRESPVRIPDIVITGADAIIIVPPLPVLPGGGIPVPPVQLAPIRFRPSPAECPPPAGGVGGLTELCEPPALVRLQPFFLAGAPPRPAMRDLGVRYPAPGSAGDDRTGVDQAANGGDGNGRAGSGGDGNGETARSQRRDE